MADGLSDSVIQGLTVSDIGDEGIHLRSQSTSNAVIDNTVRVDLTAMSAGRKVLGMSRAVVRLA